MMLPPDASDDLVTVQVPRSRLMEVYALLGAPPGEGAASKPVSSDSDWGEDFSWIVRDQRPSFVRVGAMLDALVQITPESLALDAIAKQTGLSVAELRGALTGFGRSITSKYGESEAPWTRTWGPSDTPGQDGQYYYALADDTAQAWRTAREQP
ncbi:hypothetical protein [Nocardia sp. NPDC060249]|uniref:hypothetical protein n=1 Tax=Nocardia sp. NPDC060249 TaxID=3347082 RepID=UPI0036563935